MTTDKIQLVCFDLGRVLIDICDGFREAAGRSGCVAPLTLKEPAIRRTVQDLFIEHECGRIDDDGFAQRVAAAAAWSPHAVLGMMRAWLKGPFPGVIDLIEELRHHHGVQLACLSNTNGLHWSMMSAASGDAALPLHRLHHRFASHFIGCMKPDARIYEHVEQATGVPGTGIVFFDDRADNCDAARQRGWWAHVIELDGDPVAQMRRHLASHGVLPLPG